MAGESPQFQSSFLDAVESGLEPIQFGVAAVHSEQFAMVPLLYQHPALKKKIRSALRILASRWVIKMTVRSEASLRRDS